MRSLGTPWPAVAAVALSGCAAQVVRTAPGSQAVSIPAASSKHVALNMSGAAAVRQSKDWEPFKGEWRGALQSETASAGISLAVQDGEPKPTGEAGTLLAVEVNDYRCLSTQVQAIAKEIVGEIKPR